MTPYAAFDVGGARSVSVARAEVGVARFATARSCRARAPAGKEKNWVETVPGKGSTGIFRIYGPLEAFFDQSWKLKDIEHID